MSTTYWAVFLGVLTGYLTVTLIDGIMEEVRLKRQTKYLEYLEDEADDFIEGLNSAKL